MHRVGHEVGDLVREHARVAVRSAPDPPGPRVHLDRERGGRAGREAAGRRAPGELRAEAADETRPAQERRIATDALVALYGLEMSRRAAGGAP